MMNEKIGRNDPCWCGSGKKYKRCHMRSDEEGKTTPSVGRQTVHPGKIVDEPSIPATIPRPEYAETGRPTSRRRTCKKDTPDEIERMREACAGARKVLDTVLEAVAVGVTTEELDRIAFDTIISLGAYPSTLNYRGYRKVICTSVNEVVCHGIPDDRPLAKGDIVNCDVTIYLNGMHGDCSETVFVGDVDDDARRLVEVTYESMMKGIEVVKPGTPFFAIGRAIQEVAESAGFSVVRDFTGHGIGEFFHMDPQVLHYFSPREKMRMEPGMTFTIEPMINEGSWGCRIWSDGWTAVTSDLKRSAQFEHTVLVTESGHEILTLGTGTPFFKRN